MKINDCLLRLIRPNIEFSEEIGKEVKTRISLMIDGFCLVVLKSMRFSVLKNSSFGLRVNRGRVAGRE